MEAICYNDKWQLFVIIPLAGIKNKLPPEQRFPLWEYKYRNQGEP